MTKEEKRELLFDMVEHPENYTDEQWQTLLCDDDCRHDYEALATMKSVLTRKAADREPVDTDAAWQVFSRQHPQGNLRKIAAVMTGIIIVSAIAVAALVRPRPTPPQPKPATTMADTIKPASKQAADTAKTVKADTLNLQPITFENATLREIIASMASFYHVKMAVNDETMLGVRLYFVWDKRKSLQENISLLNGFDRISLTVEGNTIK